MAFAPGAVRSRAARRKRVRFPRLRAILRRMRHRLSGAAFGLLGVLVLAACGGSAAQPPTRAKNVILFLADAGGLSTIHAASLHAHGEPNRLFLQQMPYIALSDTTTVRDLVTDSAAGMTAIVTGRRTVNGAVSIPGERDGEPLKTILEYAEERGLATGVISNDSLTGATPAATYAHVNDRNMTAAIFRQAFAPRFGDGVDVMFGSGRGTIVRRLEADGTSLEALARESGRPILASLDEVPADAGRAIVLFESSDFDVEAAFVEAHRILSQDPDGYFLMVEVDTHTNNIRRGLDRMAMMDRVIRRAAELAGPDTLLIFTADHSFDLQLRGGRPGTPLLEGLEEAEARAREEKSRTIRAPALHVENSHTGEPVIVAAQGPGAERVRGFMANTDLFDIMMEALGWAAEVEPATAAR
jgi:alkaline phosphatase|nr:MAG: alkaline phosphatase [Acidobacteriota bacterium]